MILVAVITFIIQNILKIDYFMPVSLGLIIMFIAFNFKRLNNIGKQIDFSYGVYIFHWPIMQLLVAFGVLNFHKQLSVLLMLGSVFSVAYVSWQFLERKFLKR
ncbi:hypothetical protein FACS1894147_07150 [Spirochaetia bacterium]|nr:hypothetical protein FACS1894147_07150 [Spirochaetia bacterium]